MQLYTRSNPSRSVTREQPTPSSPTQETHSPHSTLGLAELGRERRVSRGESLQKKESRGQYINGYFAKATCWRFSQEKGKARSINCSVPFGPTKFFFVIPGARLSRTPSLSGTLDASLRPGGGVWGCSGSKLWWGGTGI